jgi:hypothetical protein
MVAYNRDDLCICFFTCFTLLFVTFVNVFFCDGTIARLEISLKLNDGLFVSLFFTCLWNVSVAFQTSNANL